jgi:hypothetical protein
MLTLFTKWSTLWSYETATIGTLAAAAKINE